MAPRARDMLVPLTLAVVLTGLLTIAGTVSMAFTDYENEAEPALMLLRDGDLAGFLQSLPAYGGSLILRAPFAVAPELWGGGDHALFRMMALPGLAAALALGLVLWRRAVQAGSGRWPALLVVVLCAGNPLTLRALEIGHPEELLGGALCVAAVLAAGARRPALAGLLLGLAMANKPWALLAVAPVLIVLTERRLLALSISLLVAGIVLAPMLLAGTAEAVGRSASETGAIFQPWQIWWFFGDHGSTVMGVYTEKVGYRAAPEWLDGIARPLVVLVPLALCALLARRLQARPWHDGLLLLALVLLLRCLLDPWNVVYYELPFLLALLAWEVHARPGWPLISFAATALSWFTLQQLSSVASPDVQAAAYLAWSVPLAVAIAAHLSGRALTIRVPAALASAAQWSFAVPYFSSRSSSDSRP